MSRAKSDEALLRTIKAELLKIRQLTDTPHQLELERAVSLMKPHCPSCAEMLHLHVRAIETAHRLNIGGQHVEDPPVPPVVSVALKDTG